MTKFERDYYDDCEQITEEEKTRFIPIPEKLLVKFQYFDLCNLIEHRIKLRNLVKRKKIMIKLERIDIMCREMEIKIINELITRSFNK